MSPADEATDLAESPPVRSAVREFAPNALGQLEIAPHQAHVWYAWTQNCSPEAFDYFESLLNPDERARLGRFVFDHLKREYLLTRALCRLTLSRYAAVGPGEWHFITNQYGRPRIDPAAHGAQLSFNLSNSRSLVACIITREAEAGIDVEEIDRPGSSVAIADRYFSASEVRALHAVAPGEQPRRFFELWTLKEAYIKARGMGLAIPLAQFSFDLDAPRIGIEFDPALQDCPADWQFSLYRPSARHMMALAVRRPGREDLAICLREFVA